MKRVLGMAFLIILVGCVSNEGRRAWQEKYRGEHCPNALTELNPAGFGIGDLVRVRLSGKKGMVMRLPEFVHELGDDVYTEDMCRVFVQFKVRVSAEYGNTQFPTESFEHFELEPWPETK